MLGEHTGRTITLCALVVGLAGPAAAQSAFYQAPPQAIPGPPGTLIEQEQLPYAPAGATAYRVLYRSTGLHNEPIAVSGVVVVPPGPMPEGGRPIIAWAHPTTGVASRCAPSMALTLFQQIQGSRPMIERGYVIAATDYPGLGTPGPHPYLVGESEARAVLDSVRVARTIPGVGGTGRFGVWGHSQGGQAALFTGLIAQSYAPELSLVGVAAAAPGTDLGALLKEDIGTAGGRNLTAMTLWSWQRVFGAPMSKVVAPAAIPVVDLLAAECIESIYDAVVRQRVSAPLEQAFLSTTDITEVEPWRSLLAQNTPGTLPPRYPVFLAQGTADQLILPHITQDYMKRLCDAGTTVRMFIMPGVNHGFAGSAAANEALDWLADRFAGLPPPSDCGPR
jgi:acetyl esterase/lipase